MQNRQEEAPQPQGWEEKFDERFAQWRYRKWDLWWIDDMPEEDIKHFITTLLAQKEAEKKALVMEIVEGVKGTLELCNDDSFERVCNCHKGLADTLTALTAIAEKHGITPTITSNEK